MPAAMSEEQKECGCDNPAVTADIDPSVGGEPRVAEVEVCDEQVCETGHFLVRGDRVSFVSTDKTTREQIDRLRSTDPDGTVRWKRFIQSDVPLPPSYVLVHDAAGRLLNKCDVYVLRWSSSRRQMESDMHRSDLRAAQDYFGPEARIRGGSIDLPGEDWAPIARIHIIRYRRYGFGMFEHVYDTPVELQSTTRPLAWKLPLPDGCVIDSRGFVRP